MRNLVGLVTSPLIFRQQGLACGASNASNWLGAYFFFMDLTVLMIGLVSAFGELLISSDRAVIVFYAASAMVVFLIGWSFGAVVLTRCKNTAFATYLPIFSICLYALFTGLCAFSQCGLELTFYRFLVGSAVGMEVGVAGMSFYSSRLRGVNFLRASVAVLIVLFLGCFFSLGLKVFWTLDVWRVLFLVTALPALPILYSRVCKS